MKVVKLETFLANAGLRNYLFVRLTTDTGLTGVGEASLEWQEKTVETLIHEWVEDRILGVDPRDVERVVSELIRDQYQGGATVLTAISGVEVALWDLIGKECGQPVYQLLGGKARDQLPAYANGWYGSARTPAEYAERARQVVARGYRALKFDPFGIAWQRLSVDEMEMAEARVKAVREAVGPEVEVFVEVHGRLSGETAIAMGRRLEKHRPGFYEEPISPCDLDLLKEVKAALPFPIAAGERLYMIEEFARLTSQRAADVAQPDLCHCGGLSIGKKIATLAQQNEILLAPHVSIGPVALCAAVHFGWATPNVFMQENFSEYDVPWRGDLVYGWDLITRGEFRLPDGPGLGIEVDETACAAHPYRKNSFPSLWDRRWLEQFTQNERES
ncbi:MAG: mandelate racemase/muconate lactonizing enzyme family protein [Pirellulales bacterium]|nr:mandelate racemase/muconate lactonizing enzyme family protein [Pirellulales bacterium]